MIIFFSGDGTAASDPEIVLGDKANIMLTAHASLGRKRPHPRFRAVYRARKAKGAAAPSPGKPPKAPK